MFMYAWVIEFLGTNVFISVVANTLGEAAKLVFEGKGVGCKSPGPYAQYDSFHHVPVEGGGGTVVAHRFFGWNMGIHHTVEIPNDQPYGPCYEKDGKTLTHWGRIYYGLVKEIEKHEGASCPHTAQVGGTTVVFAPPGNPDF